MTNEIKGILDDLDYCKNLRAGNIILKYNECDELLDYITNLQEENERLNKQYDLMEQSLDEKQEVIDKAVEYIDNCFVGEEVPRGDDYVFNEYYYYEPLEKEEAIELLEILRGDE